MPHRTMLYRKTIKTLLCKISPIATDVQIYHRRRRPPPLQRLAPQMRRQVHLHLHRQHLTPTRPQIADDARNVHAIAASATGLSGQPAANPVVLVKCIDIAKLSSMANEVAVHVRL